MILRTQRGVGEQALNWGSRIVKKALCCFVLIGERKGEVPVVERGGGLSRSGAEMHRLIGNIWQRPGLGLQPPVGPHQEHTHWRTIHDPIGDVFEPVIIPLEAVIKQVKGGLRSKVEFAYRTLS